MADGTDCNEPFIWLVSNEDGFDYGIAFASHAFEDAVVHAHNVYHIRRVPMNLGVFAGDHVDQPPWWEEYPFEVSTEQIDPNQWGDGRIEFNVNAVVNDRLVNICESTFYSSNKTETFRATADWILERNLPYGSSHEYAARVADAVNEAVGDEGRQYLEDLQLQQQIMNQGKGAGVNGF